MNFDNLFGKDFLDYIESQKKQGKSLEDIAIEHNKTKEAIRSKIKRENKKVNSGTVCTPRVSTCTPKQILEEKTKEDTKENQNKKNNNGVDVEIINKLNFIINLLEKDNKEEIKVQNGGQVLQVVGQEKKAYEKTSIRVESDMWQKFKTFCKEHTDYKQQDLVTLALKEIMEKYK